MAFGFGFNKQKVLSAAEKCVQQGKLQNAISEYSKILKADPKDLTVLNTVGDLHSRLGENGKALQCFQSVGDAYAAQGFTVKAIAMYKKLSKIKSSVECVLRLAELYTQQGLFNDARAQYLQVAEEFIRSGQLDQAVRIFEKTLEMDPENVAMRSKLAEVYLKLGKKQEAWQILTAAAETLRAKGQLAAADEILQRLLKLEPNNSYALILRGRAALETGDFGAAIESLSKVSDIDNNPEGLKALFHAYLRSRRFSEAAPLVNKLANIHDDLAVVVEYTDALLEALRFGEALQVYGEYSDRLLRNDPEKLMASLRSIIRHVKDDTDALEIVLGLFLKSGENAHLAEIYELLAHGYVQSGELDKAREYYLKLMQLEPQNQIHERNYQQVLEKQGSLSSPRLITPEEGVALLDELEATAPFVEQRYDDESTLAVRAALTDAELFISYNMPAKALDPLLTALPKAPHDLRMNQRLAALHTRDGRFAEAAICCRMLETAYRDAGHAEEASRYGDLARRYEERSAAGAEVLSGEIPAALEASRAAVGQEFEVSVPAPAFSVEAEHSPATGATFHEPAPAGLFFHAAAPSISPTPEEFPASPVNMPVEEIDLSTEWEQGFSIDAPQAADSAAPVIQETENRQPFQLEVSPPASAELDSAKVNESLEEARFDLGQGMTEQVLGKLEAIAPLELTVLRDEVESASQHGAMPEPEVEVSLVDNTVEEQHEAPAAVSTPQPWPHQAPLQTASPLQDVVSDLDASLGGGFLPETLNAPVGEEKQHVTAQDSASLGSDFLPEAPVVISEAPVVISEVPVVIPEVPAAIIAPDPRVAEIEAPAARAAAAAVSSGGSIAPHSPEPVSVASGAHAGTAPFVTEPVIPDAGARVDLSDMFGELKQELEGGVTNADEDPETHYNLGVAFREMGLLDEALGEFQKVCQSVERGQSFSQLMQTYTWLAQCFLDKGIPEAAVRWYEKALRLPSLNQDTRTALHYELASSFESAGDRPAALSNFLEVYGNNIDYRDVAERIKALKP